jgi:plasmid stabilization system protein ParE
MPAAGKPVQLHREAHAELKDSVFFYCQRGGEPLAERFKKAVAIAFRAISADPLRYPPSRDVSQAKRIRLVKFPFSIIYIDRPDAVWVVAVAHESKARILAFPIKTAIELYRHKRKR